MAATRDTTSLLEYLDLKEYESTALEHLFSIGRTTAPNLAEATGIPKARIYGVLDSLSNMGYIKTIPGRPKEYQPKPLPKSSIGHKKTNARRTNPSTRHGISPTQVPRDVSTHFEQSSKHITPTEDLFYVVDVGEPSETETRELYSTADDTLNVLTKSFEYLKDVEPAFEDAVTRDIRVQILFLDPRHLTGENEVIQHEIVSYIDDTYPDVDYRFSEERLPWRGTLVDPSMNYESGRAILLVEEKDIPLHMRQAAVTGNGSFVAGMKRYFDLIWEYESLETLRS